MSIKIKESLPVNLHAVFDAPIVELDTIDSTNNYAMRLIDADTAQEGMTILAEQQTQGKGQRGNTWQDEAGKNILMSILVRPIYSLNEQFLFNVAAITAITGVLQNLSENINVQIKWPNDIIINDKKAGGVLIENVLRGSKWNYSVVGIGINVNQVDGYETLPYATSLAIEIGHSVDKMNIALAIRRAVLENVYMYSDKDCLMELYNASLYKYNSLQAFQSGERIWTVKVLNATESGKLRVINADGEEEQYTHGEQLWKW